MYLYCMYIQIEPRTCFDAAYIHLVRLHVSISIKEMLYCHLCSFMIIIQLSMSGDLFYYSFDQPSNPEATASSSSNVSGSSCASRAFEEEPFRFDPFLFLLLFS